MYSLMHGKSDLGIPRQSASRLHNAILEAGVKALATFVRTHGEEPSTQVGMFSPGREFQGASVHQCISIKIRGVSALFCILHFQVVVPRLLLPTRQ